jgi:hypothetical protein
MSYTIVIKSNGLHLSPSQQVSRLSGARKSISCELEIFRQQEIKYPSL